MVEITDMEDIEEQLKNLDEVNKIINGMKNEEISDRERAEFVTKADNLIKKKEEQKSRTVIKYVLISLREANIETSKTRINNQSSTPNPALAAMAADADERYQRKQVNIKKATKLKEEGNIEMKHENYIKAEICYTEGLELVRDMKGKITVCANGYVTYIRTQSFIRIVQSAV